MAEADTSCSPNRILIRGLAGRMPPTDLQLLQGGRVESWGG
jgi:hypothetical protein